MSWDVENPASSKPPTMGREHRSARIRTVLALGVGGLLVVSGLGFLGSKGIWLDPTEYTFSVTILNNTDGAVTVKQCGSSCGSFHEVDRLLAGESVPVNTSSDGAPNWWLVVNHSGRSIGCLNLTYHHKVSGLVIDASTHHPCPT
jgi:hypothetical protein